METGLSCHLTLPQGPGFLRPPLRSVGASLLRCPLQAVSSQRQAGERMVNFSLAGTLLRETRGWFPSTPATLQAVEKQG